MKLAIALLGLFLSLAAFHADAQTVSLEQVQERAIEFPEVMPEFPGGEEGLKKYMAENLKYPDGAEERKVQGTVVVIGIIETDGAMEHVVVLRGIDPYADEEALRLVREMPKWKPGMNNGKLARTLMRVPVTFEL